MGANGLKVRISGSLRKAAPNGNRISLRLIFWLDVLDVVSVVELLLLKEGSRLMFFIFYKSFKVA